MRDYFENTREIFNKYNNIIGKIWTGDSETTDEEDEFLDNFALYFAHALLKDYGSGGVARDELLRMAKIIETIIAESN